MPATTFVDWATAREAVARAGPRFTAMLRAVTRPDAPALGDWDVTQLAAHVSHAADTIWAMSKGGGNLIDDITGLATLTKVMVEGEGRRPLDELADRIDATVTRFLADMEAAAKDAPRTWLTKGSELPMSTLTCHMLNELTVHGHDIARALGMPWPIERAHAALVVYGFMFPALNTVGRDLLVQGRAGSARFEVRLRGHQRAWLRFDRDDFAVEGSPQGPVDCYLSVDPAAFMLVGWGRRSQLPAIARGQLLAWGRKPWMGPQLRAWLRNP